MPDAALGRYLEGNEYVEVFWLPLSSGLWAKSWNRTDAPARRRPWTTVPRDYLRTAIGNVVKAWQVVVDKVRERAAAGSARST